MSGAHALARRHRLAPGDRAGSALRGGARDAWSLALDGPATVYLSVRARTTGVAPADVERALYDDRSLVRVLAMRRTLWVVPRELLAVVHAACTRDDRHTGAPPATRGSSATAASPRARRPGCAGGAGGARGGRGARRGVHERAITRNVPLLATKLRFGDGTLGERARATSARVLPPARDGRERARPAAGTWSNGQYRWVPTADWLRAPRVEDSTRRRRRRSSCGTGCGAFGPATETDLSWWTRLEPRGVRAALAAVRARRSTSTGRPASCWPTTTSRSSRRSLGRACSPRSTRRHGLEGARLVPRRRTRRCSST